MTKLLAILIVVGGAVWVNPIPPDCGPSGHLINGGCYSKPDVHVITELLIRSGDSSAPAKIEFEVDVSSITILFRNDDTYTPRVTIDHEGNIAWDGVVVRNKSEAADFIEKLTPTMDSFQKGLVLALVKEMRRSAAVNTIPTLCTWGMMQYDSQLLISPTGGEKR